MVNVLLLIPYFILGGKTNAKFRALKLAVSGFYVKYLNCRQKSHKIDPFQLQTLITFATVL